MVNQMKVRYSITSKAYKIFNKRTLIIEESIHVIFDEYNHSSSRKEEYIDDNTGIMNKKMKLKNDQAKKKRRGKKRL